MNPFALLDPVVAVLHHLLVLTSSALPWPSPPGVRVAIALVGLTLAVRAALLPLAIRALRSARAREALAPQLAAARRRHATDPSRLATETTRIYREAGVSPAAGLLPAIAQAPVLASLYRLVVVPTVAGSPNLVLASRLFGAPLAAHWPEVIAAGGMLGAGTVAALVLLVALTGLALVSARALGRNPGTTPEPAGPAGAAGAAGSAGSAAGVPMVGLLRLLPFGTVLVAAVSPVAVGLYLITTTAWSVAERRWLPRLVPA
jgi:YidC/Oxa1 family membrane protein insertase